DHIISSKFPRCSRRTVAVHGLRRPAAPSTGARRDATPGHGGLRPVCSARERRRSNLLMNQLSGAKILDISPANQEAPRCLLHPPRSVPIPPPVLSRPPACIRTT